MKKLVLSLVAVSTMLAAGTANAAPTPFSGQLDFSGVITSTAPAWKWEIPVASQALAKGWKITKESGVTTRNTTVYTINKAAIPFVQGYTTKQISGGGAGQAPEVTVDDKVVGDTSMILSVIAKGGNNEEGMLKMTLTAGVASAYQDLSGTRFAGVPTSSSNLSKRAWEMIRAQSVTSSTPADTTFKTVMARFGQGSQDTALTAAVATELGEFSLTFSNGSIPDAWTATVPVVVTYL